MSTSTSPSAGTQTGTQWDVQIEAAKLLGGAPELNSESPIPFFHILHRLKTTKREGWRRFGILDGESISDHMYRMGMISMFPPSGLESRLNIARCSKMALIHDMAEALVGDITPVDGVDKTEKSRRETTTMQYFTSGLLGNVSGGRIGQDIMEVWQEYEDDKTLEAHYVHDIDKIELLLQMTEYERAHNRELDLGEFSWVSSKVKLPEMKKWSAEILKEREDFWGDKEHHSYQPADAPSKGHLEYYGNGTQDDSGHA
ncbi:HD domain-containing protein [Bisporella sp. PMI_857]|nr:HD domain-containing protein [Bisporella sp. PMI_857]